MTTTIEDKLLENNFTVQWHITTQCDMDCSICYIPSDEKKQSSLHDLTIEESFHFIDDVFSFSKTFGFKPNIVFTGGNPLLSEHFFELLDYSNTLNIPVRVLGNPSPLNDSIVTRLKNSGIFSYQISLDGLEQKHDSIRGEGAFKKASNAIEYLSDHNIPVVVMSTVTTQNKNDVLALPEYVLNLGASKFDFARLVPVGNGKSMNSLMFSPQGYKSFLTEMFQTYTTLIDKGYSPSSFGVKDHLWKLFFYERGEFYPDTSIEYVVDGCSVGVGGFCMDSDGSLYGCRRIGDVIDNIRNTSVEEFMFKNDILESYRHITNFEKCGVCDLLNYCRGCPAISKNVHGSYFSKDPQCWK